MSAQMMNPTHSETYANEKTPGYDSPLSNKDETLGHGRPSCASPCNKTTFDHSRIDHNQLGCLPGQKYYSWAPENLSANSPVVVVVHGIGRKALAQIEAFAPLAQSYSALIVAPLFEKTNSRDYQRLGRAGFGPRSDYSLNAILDEISRTYAVKSDRFYLWGYSAGAQFAHRYAFAHPQRIMALSLGAAGWYTFPHRLKYPLGTEAILGLPDLSFNPGQLARTPVRVYVGEGDIKRKKSLNRSRIIDKQQGRNRLQRAQNWVAQMQEFHHRQGCGSQVDLELLPGVGHSFSRCTRRHNLPSRIMGFFFGTDCKQAGNK